MFLHAWKIEFPHPISGKTLALEAPLPDALEAFLKQLTNQQKQDYGQKI
jgi:23S rRNA pseudouridine955/2504/2580 synthase